MASIAQTLHKKFFTGSVAYAVARQTEENGVAYAPVSAVVAVDEVEKHLMGSTTLGAYTLRPDNTVLWCCFDVDSKDLDQAKTLTLQLTKALGELPYSIEFSGRKGYHVFLFFKTPEPADNVKNLLEAIREKIGAKRSGETHIEVFPKQGQLTASNPLGNLIKLPLGIHPGSGRRSQFVDPSTGWESGPPVDPLSALNRTTNLAEIAQVLGRPDDDPLEKIVEILRPHWLSGQRHDLALHLSGWLAHSGWDEEDALTIVEKLHDTAGGDLNNQLSCVTDTFKRFAAGESVQGFHALLDILPGTVLRSLAAFVDAPKDSDIKFRINQVRTGKGQKHDKSDRVVNLILDYLSNEGELLKDSDSQRLHWLDSLTHQLYTLETLEWEIALYNLFGINSVESFGKITSQAIVYSAHEHAAPVKTYSRSYWDGEKLYINLGTHLTYILDGTEQDNGSSPWSDTCYNGENGSIFRNQDSDLTLDLPAIWQQGVRPVDPWEYLVDDLNYAIGNTGVTPWQQKELLKAWFLSTFFPNIMPTRPLLAIVADSGAGKTSAARRLVQVLEGPSADVNGLETDKPDSLRTSITNHGFLAIDNLERTKAAWLSDMLNRVATGTHIELRKYYSTNEVQRFIPNCYIILTATTLPFSEETLFTRMLPIELATIDKPIAENEMKRRTLQNLPAIWMGILRMLQPVVAQLRKNHLVPAPTASRLADFSTFCARLNGVPEYVVDSEELMKGQENLVNRQKALLHQSSQLVPVLEIWLRQEMEKGMAAGIPSGIDNAKWKTATELNGVLFQVAQKNHLEWIWTSGQSLSKHMQMLEPQLIRHFGMQIQKGSNRNVPKRYRFEMMLQDTDYDEETTIDLHRNGSNGDTWKIDEEDSYNETEQPES